MAKTKFTPGSWSAFVKGRTIAIDIGSKSHGQRPNIIDWGGFDGCDLPLRTQKANAHLIAAAPDMYEALDAVTTELKVFCELLHDNDTREAVQRNVNRGLEVLSKARGEAS